MEKNQRASSLPHEKYLGTIGKERLILKRRALIHRRQETVLQYALFIKKIGFNEKMSFQMTLFH